MRTSAVILGLHLSCIFFFLPQAMAQKIDPGVLHGMKPRSVGPAGMSGRITDIAVHKGIREVIYAGTASGGLWKSESGGIDWHPIFDTAPVNSVGSIALDPTNADLIWVGTGEGNPRNSQNSGSGIFRSLDGGHSWTCMGLENSRNIHRIIVDPTDPETVYAGVQGSAWGDSEERGVYKTIDGGKTWEKMLYVNASTGIADLVLDPQNPKKLIAAMWQFRRWPWFFKSGGPGSGIFMTWDGGQSWKKITSKEGLPGGEMGRAGLAIAPSNPNIVYALVEAKTNALYASEDGGRTWKMVNNKNIGNRPFYYADLYVDPKDPKRIYNLHTFVTKSEDGGKTFDDFLPWNNNPSNVHPDHHAWWIDPDDPDRMLDGNDGGLNITYDGGETWRFVANLPLGQFYHIHYDMEIPYNIYGGMQDNGSWKGPAYTWSFGGIRNSYWTELNFGDGFDVVPDAADARYGYSMSQGGNLSRHDALTGQKLFIKPVHPGGMALRFNWNAAIARDPHDPGTIYFGSQFLHRSADRGHSWAIISPDLTTNDPEKQKQKESGGLTPDVTSAENFTTIVSIEPSPTEEGVIWVGSDDGMLHLTRDGGESWTNLSRMLSDVPTGSWITQIHASRIHKGEVFLAVNNYRRNDWSTYLLHTTDYGKSWKNLAAGKEINGHTLSVVQDNRQPRLLFAGTETGLFFSLDYGSSWNKWPEDLPPAPVMDLKIHPREEDLIIGTFGRSAHIIDDIQPLRHLAGNAQEVLDTPLLCFPAKAAYLSWQRQAEGIRFAADAEFIGENRSYGAGISFYLKSLGNVNENPGKDPPAEVDSVDVHIANADGETVRTLRVSCKPGINRFYWDLSRNGIRSPQTPKKSDQLPSAGRKVLPGVYRVKLEYKGVEDAQEVTVLPDPRYTDDPGAAKAREALWQRHEENKATTTAMTDDLRDALKTTKFILAQATTSSEATADTVRALAQRMTDSIGQVLYSIIPEEDAKGLLHGEIFLHQKQDMAERYLSSLSIADMPSENVRLAIAQYEEMQHRIIRSYNKLMASSWPQFLDFLERNNFRYAVRYPQIPIE